MNKLWKYLNENDIKLDVSDIPKYLKCPICDNILKDAVYSSCGCNYCKLCIREYIDRDTKLCPGCLKCDTMNEISYEEDISEDNKSNIVISKLSVSCPFAGCTEMYEMRHLHDHLLCCKKSRSKCLFHLLGCEWPIMNNEEEDKHLDTDRKKHYIMMVGAVCCLKHHIETVQPNQIEIENIGNEINRLKKETAEIRNAICEREATFHNTDSGVSETTSELEMIQLNFNTMKEEIAQLKEGRETDGIKLAQMELKLATLKQNREEDRQKIVSDGEEIGKIKMERQNLKSELEEVKKDTANLAQMKEELNSFIGERNADKKKIISIEEIVAKLKNNRENDQIKIKKEMNDFAEAAAKTRRDQNEISKYEKELAQLKKDIATNLARIERELNQLRNEREKDRKQITLLKDDMKKANNEGPKKQSGDKTNVAAQQNITKTKEVVQIEGGAGATAEGLHWTVTQLSQYQNQNRWSEPFTISGYSMIVGMRWYWSKDIGADLWLLRSMGDTGVSWPMRLCLRLRVADPDSGAEIWSREIQCDQARPQQERIRVGGTDWINLAGHDCVTRTDSVLISVELF